MEYINIYSHFQFNIRLYFYTPINGLSDGAKKSLTDIIRILQEYNSPASELFTNSSSNNLDEGIWKWSNDPRRFAKMIEIDDRRKISEHIQILRDIYHINVLIDGKTYSF
jgi:hypothetical protein